MAGNSKNSLDSLQLGLYVDTFLVPEKTVDKKIMIIRHGESEKEVDKNHNKNVSKGPKGKLTQNGIKQIKENGSYLCQALKDPKNNLAIEDGIEARGEKAERIDDSTNIIKEDVGYKEYNDYRELSSLRSHKEDNQMESKLAGGSPHERYYRGLKKRLKNEYKEEIKYVLLTLHKVSISNFEHMFKQTQGAFFTDYDYVHGDLREWDYNKEGKIVDKYKKPEILQINKENRGGIISLLKDNEDIQILLSLLHGNTIKLNDLDLIDLQNFLNAYFKEQETKNPAIYDQFFSYPEMRIFCLSNMMRLGRYEEIQKLYDKENESLLGYFLPYLLAKEENTKVPKGEIIEYLKKIISNQRKLGRKSFGGMLEILIDSFDTVQSFMKIADANGYIPGDESVFNAFRFFKKTAQSIPSEQCDMFWEKRKKVSDNILGMIYPNEEREIITKYNPNMLEYLENNNPLVQDIRSKSLDKNIQNGGNPIDFKFSDEKYNDLDNFAKSDKKIVYVEGNAGIGKSLLGAKINENYVKNKFRLDANQEGSEYLLKYIHLSDLNSEAFDIQGPKDQKIVYVYDSLDESNIKTDNIEGILQSLLEKEGTHIITCRKGYFPNSLKNNADIQLLEIQEFDQNDIEKFLYDRFGKDSDEANRFLGLQKSGYFQGIETNPLILGMICDIFPDIKENEEISLGSIYEKIVDKKLRYEGNKKGKNRKDHVDDNEISDEENREEMIQNRKNFLAEIAYESMINRDLKLDKEYIKTKKKLHGLDKTNNENINILFKKNDKTEEYAFVHETFKEYFLCQYLLEIDIEKLRTIMHEYWDLYLTLTVDQFFATDMIKRDKIVSCIIKYGDTNGQSKSSIVDVISTLKEDINHLFYTRWQEGKEGIKESIEFWGIDSNFTRDAFLSSLYLDEVYNKGKSSEFMINLHQRILEKGFDINGEDDATGSTLLSIACLFKNKDLINELIKYGADVDKEIYGGISLWKNLYRLRKYELFEHILPHVKKEKIDQDDDIGVPLLWEACMESNYKVVELLIKNGASMDNLHKGKSLLFFLLEQGNIEMVRFLFTQGARLPFEEIGLLNKIKDRLQ